MQTGDPAAVGSTTTDQLRQAVEWIGLGIEVAGVLVILIGAALALVRFVPRFHAMGANEPYEKVRHGLGRSIMVGLEFLVAGDIVRTVVSAQTYESLGLLAIVVLIRTFLSMSLFVEVEGRWPWQPERGNRD